MGWEDREFNKDSGSGPKFIFPMPTKLTFALILACIIVFVFEAIYRTLALDLALIFPGWFWYAEPWRWITYQYVHGGGLHIFLNLIGIYFFVPTLERSWGWKRTLGFYTAGGIVAGICAALLSLVFHGEELILIGASGSIMAVIGAVTALDPDDTVYFFVFPMTMRTMALLFGVFYVLMIIGEHSLADAAHLGGLIFGFVAPFYGASVYRRWSRQLHQRRAKQQVRSVQFEQETVDRILEKVHISGMHSLTRGERRSLKKATEHQKHRDLEAARVRAKL